MAACSTKAAASLHARVAGASRRATPKISNEVVETLAHHFELGADVAKGCRVFLARRRESKAAIHLSDRAGVCAKRRETITERDPALKAVRAAGARAAGRPAQPDGRPRAGKSELRRRDRGSEPTASDHRRLREKAAPRRASRSATASRSPTTCTGLVRRRSCSSIPSSMVSRCFSRLSSDCARSSASSRLTRAGPAHRTRCGVRMA